MNSRIARITGIGEIRAEFRGPIITIYKPRSAIAGSWRSTRLQAIFQNTKRPAQPAFVTYVGTMMDSKSPELMRPDGVDAPEIGLFQSSDGYEMHTYRWKPRNGRPLGYIAILHGIQSHAGWYERSCRQFCEAGYDVRFLDRRGSGRNTADRGHTDHADRLLNDVVEWTQTITHARDTANHAAAVVMLAISWGGKLATIAASRRPGLVDGIGLLCPGLKPFIRPNIIQKMLLRLGMRLGKSRKTVPIPLADPALFTPDPEWQRFIRDDPLALRGATVGLLHASVMLDEEIPAAISRLNCPALLMLAENDLIIDNHASTTLWEQTQSDLRELILYKNACHTLEFDPVREQCNQDIMRWIQKLRRGREDALAAKG